MSILRKEMGYALSLGLAVLVSNVFFLNLGFAAEESIPQAEAPDACKGGSQDKMEECKRWYYLTEADHPDAWEYNVRNREEPKRWYVIAHKTQAHVEAKPSRIIVLEGVHFNYDKAELRPDALPILQNNVSDLKSSNIQKIKVVGHTDAMGSDEYNKELSEKRAQSVVNYFASNGISTDRIVAEGHGEEDPVAPNSTPDGKDNPEGRAKNRRVEIHIWDSYAGLK